MERSGEGVTGRFLCDLDVRLSRMKAITDSTIFAPGTRLADHVEVVDDMAPMPGVWCDRPSGHDGVYPAVMLGGWGFAGYVLEMALIGRGGAQAAKSCGGMWRAWTLGPPRKITPDMLRDPEDGDFGEDWKKA